jgi:Ni/Co efflux regulator RcnB
MSISRSSRFAVLAACALCFAAPAFADKGEHGDKESKHADKEWEKAEKHADKDRAKAEKHGDRDDVRVGQYFNDQNREAARVYYGQQYGNGGRCPPGLAKKHNGCLPPGQVRYVVGQPLPRTVIVYPVPQPVIVQLPIAPPGYRYVRSGNDILLLSPQSQMVVDVIAGLLR